MPGKITIKKENAPRQVAPPVREEEKASVRDYKSEDRHEVGRTTMEYAEAKPKHKTPEQMSEDQVAPTSADEPLNAD